MEIFKYNENDKDIKVLKQTQHKLIGNIYYVIKLYGIRRIRTKLNRTDWNLLNQNSKALKMLEQNQDKMETYI